MSDPYVGEIRILAIPNGRAPSGWALCNGALLSVGGNPALFSLIGTSYGGDGVNTFAVPDLRGRLPVGQGSGPGLTSRTISQAFGTETVVLTGETTPQHTHTFNTFNTNATAAAITANAGFANTAAPTVAYLKDGLGTAGGTQVTLNNLSVTNSGGNLGHDNVMPCATMNFIICIEGLYPTRGN